MDREYAISFTDKDGILDELNLHAAVLQEAKYKAMYYIKNGFKQVTIKLYDNGNLQHQWDYKDGKWIQYE